MLSLCDSPPDKFDESALPKTMTSGNAVCKPRDLHATPHCFDCDLNSDLSVSATCISHAWVQNSSEEMKYMHMASIVSLKKRRLARLLATSEEREKAMGINTSRCRYPRTPGSRGQHRLDCLIFDLTRRAPARRSHVGSIHDEGRRWRHFLILFAIEQMSRKSRVERGWMEPWRRYSDDPIGRRRGLVLPSCALEPRRRLAVSHREPTGRHAIRIGRYELGHPGLERKPAKIHVRSASANASDERAEPVS